MRSILFHGALRAFLKTVCYRGLRALRHQEKPFLEFGAQVFSPLGPGPAPGDRPGGGPGLRPGDGLAWQSDPIPASVLDLDEEK